MVEINRMSPSASGMPGPSGLNFTQALDRILEGKRVTKDEWENDEEYGFMKSEILHLHRNGKDHKWIIGQPDIEGQDYRVLGDK